MHLFTLGVLTAVIVAFTRHFSASFTGQGAPSDRRGPLLAAIVLDLSVVALLIGRLTHGRVLLSLGTLGLLGVVGGNLWGLRTARRTARAQRFTWIVRRYEDAHIAFLVAALLGTSIGIGLVTGPWYLGARDAHMHLNVLGWAGLTVLATLVVFGPAMLRARMRPGADGRASTALRGAAVALLVAAGGLVLTTGLEGSAGVAARVVATAGLVGYGAAVLVVVSAVLGAARSSDRSPVRWLVAGAAGWLPVGVALDVLVVATSQRAVLDAVGVILFIGVLTQLILAVAVHLAPQLRGRDFAARDALLHRSERLAAGRAAALNVGVAAVTVGIALAAWADLGTAMLVRGGWTLVGLGVLLHLVPVLWPLGPVDPHEVRSATAARYRGSTD